MLLKSLGFMNWHQTCLYRKQESWINKKNGVKEYSPMKKSLIALLVVPLLVLLFAEYAQAQEVRTYSGSAWRTIYGGRAAVNAFCAKRLGRSYRGRWGGCFLPRERVIACSDVRSCLHEAIHAADPHWGPSHAGNGHRNRSTIRLSLRRTEKSPNGLTVGRTPEVSLQNREFDGPAASLVPHPPHNSYASSSPQPDLSVVWALLNPFQN